MGQAKQRGDFSARQQEALEAGRVKTSGVKAYHETPVFRIPNSKLSLIDAMTNRVSSPSLPFHRLSEGAERTVEELNQHPDMRTWS